MAGTIMHLVIADRLLDKLEVRDIPLFYCGNLVPDAIMAREGYTREMKRHTHFKDGIHLDEVHLEENFRIYRERFYDFIDKYLHVGDEMYDLFFGYITHMLVDELYILELRDRHVERLIAQGLTPSDKPYFHKFTRDVDQIDFELVRSYTFKHPMPETVLSRSDYEIPGYITNEEVEDSKQFVIHKNFYAEHEKEPLQVMTFEENQRFMDICVERIPGMLRELGIIQ